jgi:hypothetical protein
MYFATVAWLTSMPSLRSSPWIRGAPQSRLALRIRRIRSRISRSTEGLPDLERQRQNQAESLTVLLDYRCWLDQDHRFQTAWPQSVEQDPEQAVESRQPEPTRPPAAKNVQLVTEREVL